MSKTKTCSGCGCREGELHKWGCLGETCPFCHKFLLECDCAYRFHGHRRSQPGAYAGLDIKLNEEEKEQWREAVFAKGRIPFVGIPRMCVLCGEFYPLFFGRREKDWMKFVIPELQDEILCRKCYGRMVKLFPEGWKRAAQEFSQKEAGSA